VSAGRTTGGESSGERSPAGELLGRAELRDVIDAVDEAVVIFDDRGDVLSMNPAGRRLHGCVDGACAMPLAEYVRRYEAVQADGSPLAADQRPLSRALRGEAVHDLELGVHDVESGRRWVGIYSAVPLVSSEGRRLVTVTIRDVTERKHAFDALRAADRRKDDYLAMLSHELRNPLAPIRSAVYLLERADPASDGARRAREVVARQVGHLARMVDDLLDVSRISRGRIELRRARLELGELVRRVGDDHRPLLGAAGVELDVVVPEGPVLVDGDATRLAQLLGNLLQNSAKFTPRDGRVTLSLREEGGAAVLQVRDTGDGIEAAVLDHVFEPFVQGDRTLARSHGGLGLGLPLVKGLAELHGGSVEVRSGGRGAGTELTVRLPLAAEQGVESAAREPQRGHTAGRRVLVVDDNVDAAEALCDVVAFFGHTVEAVHDGAAALARAREHHPDVVLCDIGLPDMDGYAVARAIRADAALRDVRLVAVSGYAQPEDRERAAQAGFDEHVAKPADPSAIGRLLA
jgi:signal transduction histidine kinase/BarA-like signal transduction histidine kinase